MSPTIRSILFLCRLPYFQECDNRTNFRCRADWTTTLPLGRPWCRYWARRARVAGTLSIDLERFI